MHRLNLDVVSISGGNSLSLSLFSLSFSFEWLEALISFAIPENRECSATWFTRFSSIHTMYKKNLRTHVATCARLHSLFTVACVRSI